MRKAPVFSGPVPMKIQLPAGVSPISHPIYDHFKTNYPQAETDLTPTHSRLKAGLIPKKCLREANQGHGGDCLICLMIGVRLGAPPWGVEGFQADIRFLPAVDWFYGGFTSSINGGDGILKMVRSLLYGRSKTVANRGLTGEMVVLNA